MGDNRPIGVFDSGVGGLTVLHEMHRSLPYEATMYVADLAYFPYGAKPRDFVQDRALSIADHLLQAGVKAIVVACNTATSAALPQLANSAPCPVIGVVQPGARAAVDLTRNGNIGVIATEGTTRSHAYRDAITACWREACVTELACGSLVGLIEAGQMSSKLTIQVVEDATSQLIRQHGCDTIILGCTHFPLVRRAFERAAGGKATIVDSVSTTVRALDEVLRSADLVSSTPTPASHDILVTAHADAFVHQARILFGAHVQATITDIPKRAAALAVSSAC